jgi:hypothetical protein
MFAANAEDLRKYKNKPAQTAKARMTTRTITQVLEPEFTRAGQSEENCLGKKNKHKKLNEFIVKKYVEFNSYGYT